MAKKIEKKSNTPLFIIGGVLIVALLGGWWLFSSAKQTANTNTAKSNSANAPKAQTIPPNAPPGADPPHQSGSPTAAVTVEEFADFQCPLCAATHPVLNEIKATYGSRIKFVFRDYPLEIPAHDKAYDAAVAAEAAGMQNPNKFWEMQNMLFTNQRAWTTDPNYKQVWKDYAQKIGLDTNKWESDMAGIAAKMRVDEDKKRAKAIGVSSTPTIFINGQAVAATDMNVDGFRKIIDAELQKTSPQSQTGNPAGAAPANAANATK
jgi:protein-disulfide isomerase